MSEHVFFTTVLLFLGTILLIFLIRYAALVFQAWARQRSDGDYRALAEQAAATQAENAASLASITTRLASVERILKDVE